MGTILIPFVISFIIAYILRQPRDLLIKYTRVSKSIATFSTIVILIALLVIATVFMIPIVKDAIEKVVEKLPSIVNGITDAISVKLKSVYKYLKIKQNVDIKSDINKYVVNTLQHANNYLPNLIIAGKAIINTIVYVILTPILSFYILYDFTMIEKRIMLFTIQHFSKKVAIIIKNININIEKYIKGQFLICAILFITYSTTLAATGIDDFIVCAIITSLLAFIPFFGTLCGLLITIALSIDTITKTQVQCVIITYVAIVMIDSNFITPNLIGRRIGVKPFMLLSIICISGALFGFTGIILSMPISIIIVTILKSISHIKQNS